MWMGLTEPQPLGWLRYLGRVAAVAVAVMAVTAPATAQLLDAADVSRRDRAVAAARAGDFASGLAALGALRDKYPGDESIVYDLIAVHSWAEDDQAVVDLGETLSSNGAPRYVQLAVAKSARNILRFDIAAIWYDAVLARDPADVDALSGRLLTAGDARDREAVARLLAEAGPEIDDDQSIATARAYALRMSGSDLQALVAYDAVLARQPTNAEALRGKALVLRSMLLPTQALDLAASHPGILTEAEIDRLRADEAAVRLRLSVRTPYPEPVVDRGARQSLADIEAKLTTTTTAAGREALLLDRIVALADLNEAEAAIEHFESLPESTNLEQPYLLVAVANAYLQAEQPGRALELLQRALEIDPAHLSARFSLVYAWLDLDRYPEAFRLADELTAELPMSLQSPVANVIKGNEERLQAELLAGITDAYGDQLEAAQARFEALLGEAPNNGSLRHELANVYRWRGWLDRSLDEYRQVLTTNDDFLAAELGHAHAALDAREYSDVEETVNEASEFYPREPAVRRLAERWQIHNERELSIDATSGDSTGPVSGANNYRVDARWYTAPLRYRYRTFVTTHDSYAEFPEGQAERRRIGAGIEFRSPRFTVAGQLSGSRNDGDPGVAVSVDYRPGDLWSVSTGVASNSDDVQLRAQRLGIESDRIYFLARYAPSELASIDMGVDRMDYADDNAIQRSFIDGRYRLLNRPRSKLEATGSLAYGQADSSAVPYFSPTSDKAYSLGVAHMLRLRRRYERELNQTIRASAGRYAQQGFSAGSTWSLSYRLDWAISARHSLGFEGQRLGQFFDGVREHTTLGIFSLNSRF